MSTVFVGKAFQNKEMTEPIAHDDAAEVDWIALEQIDNMNMAFDHKRIISDYKLWQRSGGTFWSSKEKSSSHYD